MKQIQTESGAVYLWDEPNHRVVRLVGPMNSQIRIDNGEWFDYSFAYVSVGESAVFHHPRGLRGTTPVLSIEDVPDE